MNKWIKRSFRLATENFYLDNLLEIYPPEEIERGLVVEKEAPELKSIFRKGNYRKLLEELIRLKKIGFKFPIENPYVSFLSMYPEAIAKNPRIVRVIVKSLLKMSYKELKKKLESPKKASRTIGPMFQNWIKKKFNAVDVRKFNRNKRRKIIFLLGADKQLKDYAEQELRCKFNRLAKGLDFLGKSKDKYIIGTAKFITDTGGTQDNQFYEAVRFIKETRSPKNVIKVATIDGVVWLKGKSRKGRKTQRVLDNLKRNEFCFSALLLKDFLNELN